MGQQNFQSIQPMTSNQTQSTLSPPPSANVASLPEEDVDLGHYFEALVAQKWLIAAITVVVLAIGVVYAMLQRPIYESNLLIQV